MDWNNFTPYASTIGGLLIGCAVTLLLLLNGKICGISGITGQILSPKKDDFLWRACFFVGLVGGGFVVFRLYPASATFDLHIPVWLLVIAGILVGYGTRLGNGCTSGHGICGISRLSIRSILATCVFMVAGMLTVYLVSSCL